MATFDFTILPAKVTITNSSGRAKAVQFFKTNLTQLLAAGDVLEIVVDSSAELFYWQAKADGELTVSAAKVLS